MHLCRVHGNLEMGDRCAEVVDMLDLARFKHMRGKGLGM